MKSWVVRLRPQSCVGDNTVQVWKAWEFDAPVTELRWDFRMILESCGYACDMQWGGVHNRIADFKRPLVEFLSRFDMQLESPFYGASFHSEVRRKRRRHDEERAPLAAEQEYWVTTKLAVVIVLFLFVHRRGRANTLRVQCVLQELLTCTIHDNLPATAAKELVRRYQGECPEPKDSEGFCMHANSAPAARNIVGEPASRQFTEALCWATCKRDNCPALLMWLRHEVGRIAAAIVQARERWGDPDLIRCHELQQMARHRKKQRRFDIHVREQLCNDVLAPGHSSSLHTAWRVLKGDSNIATMWRQEVQQLQDIRAAQFQIGALVSTIGASYDATRFGSPSRDCLLSFFYCHKQDVCCIGAPQVALLPSCVWFFLEHP